MNDFLLKLWIGQQFVPRSFFFFQYLLLTNQDVDLIFLSQVYKTDLESIID